MAKFHEHYNPSQKLVINSFLHLEGHILKNNAPLKGLIAQRIALTMKPYSKGDFVKKCLADVAEEMCTKMVQEFEKISLSR